MQWEQMSHREIDLLYWMADPVLFDPAVSKSQQRAGDRWRSRRPQSLAWENTVENREQAALPVHLGLSEAVGHLGTRAGAKDLTGPNQGLDRPQV